MNEFKLENAEYVELKNLLKLMGLCETGGAAMAAVAEGLVKVDGQVELRKRCKIRTGQVVEFEGKKIVVKAVIFLLSLVLLFPSTLWARKKHVREKRPARHEIVRMEVPIATPPPDGNSPVWDFWKSVLKAREQADQGNAQEALDLLSHLPPPPADVMNKNQTFYRRLYKQALQIGLSAADGLSQDNSSWARGLWAWFPDFPDFNDASEAVFPSGVTAADKAARIHILSQKSLFDSIPPVASPDEIAGADLPSADKCRALFELGTAFQKLSRKDEAVAAYDQVSRASCDDKLLARSLYWKGMMESGLKQYDAAEATFKRLAGLSDDGKYTDDAYDQLAKVYQAQNEEDKADEALKKLIDLPQGDRKEKYLWDQAYAAYLSKDYDQATESLDRIVDSKFLGTEAQPQAMYWKARIEEIRSGKKLGGGSAALYRKILKTYPFSFYTIFAETRLGESASLPPIAKSKDAAPSDKSAAEGLKAVDELNRKKRHEDALDVLDYVTHLHPELAKENPEAVAQRWADSGDYNRALELSAEKLDQSAFDVGLNKDSALTRTLYPLAYVDLVKRAAKENRLPLGLIEGIMREESLFLRSVRSHAGAVGVMQLMPATARIKARKLGVSFSQGDLSDPAANIELGSSFLAELMDRFGDQMPLAVMGYNAGPGNVSKWLGSQGGLPFDEFVEAVPFTETRGYVKRVLRSAHIYGHLLNDRKSTKPFKSMDPPQ